MTLKPKQTKKQNLTKDELNALNNLQNRSDLVITRADKGGAVVLLDTEAYIKEANRQLNDTDCYMKLTIDPTVIHTEKVKHTLHNLKESQGLPKKFAENLIPNSTKTPNFYLLPKIHKKQTPTPGRPVVNSINSPTSAISKYVDHHLQPIVTQLPSYVKDTTDFINKLEQIRTAPKNCILVTMDVKSLYTNIPHNEGIEATKKFMSKHNLKPSLITIITTLLTLILTLNNFIFNGIHYLQKMGVAMGTKCAPTYANIFMGDFEEKYIYPYLGQHSTLYLRFIDDIFMIWNGTKEELDKFILTLNHQHNTIKFDIKTSTKEIEFLDTKVFIDERNQLKTKLYTKDTDTHNYLHRTSAHPERLKKAIPYGQALRIRRICTEEEDATKEFKNLQNNFIKKGYNKTEVSAEILRAKNTPRTTTLTSKDKKTLNRTPLVLTYNPSLPPIMDVIKKHWHVLQSDSSLSETFKELPITSFRRNKNLGDLLNSKTLKGNQVVRSLPPKSSGMSKPCHRRQNNKCCQHVKSAGTFKSARTGKSFTIYDNLTCKSGWIIYLLECRLCPTIQYVGKSESPANIRINKHRDDCKTPYSIDIDQHFRKLGHDFNKHATFTFIEQLKHTDRPKLEKRKILEKREDFWIMKLETLKPRGLNAKLNHY